MMKRCFYIFKLPKECVKIEVNPMTKKKRPRQTFGRRLLDAQANMTGT